MDAIWTQFSVVLCCLILHSGLSFAAFEDVAKGKTTSSSGGVRASDAVDGNTVSGNFQQCVEIRPESRQNYTWWEVDLGKPYYLHQVTIYFRTDFKWRRNGVHVYISSTARQINKGHLCGTVTGKPDGTDIPHITSITCDDTGRYVTLYLATDNGQDIILDFCEVQVYSCELNVRYGPNCNKLCQNRHCASSSPPCDVKTGDCGNEGCQPGWQGDDCTQECETNVKYGSNCKKSCDQRHCAVTTSPCSSQTGACVGGCLPGWKGNDCTLGCESNVKYGSNCTNFCNKRHCAVIESPCSVQTGDCGNGRCHAGWKGADCTQSCEKNVKYGSNCDQFCDQRHCAVNTSLCSADIGTCFGGCQSGWKEDDCTQECDGTYGVNCSLPCSKRHCKNDNSPCDSRTGECYKGCKPGWMNLTCTQPCADGQYGEGCEQSCSERHCHGNNECAAKTGQCVDGCTAGWKGPMCISPCSSVTYGINCNLTCGKCESESCDAVSGNCTAGCEDGFEGHLCMERIAAQSSSIGTIVGPVVGVIVIVILAVIVGVVLMRRRRMAKNESTHSKTGTGDDTKTRSKPDTKHSNDKKIKRKIRAPKRQTDDADVYVNVGPRAIPDGTEFPEVDESAVKMDIDSAVEEMDEDDDDVDEPRSVYYITDYNLLEGSVAVGELARSIEQIRSQTGGFEKEYKKLQSGFSSSYDESQIPKNRPKNRFAGYYPYDNNRVTLTMLPDVPHSDYINASYLDAHAEKNYFIAAQAPNALTVPDFWRMMWEKNCGHIIMLTKLVEATKNKCDPYWSDTEVLNIGQYKIALAKKEERSDFVFRKLKVTHRKSGQSKTFQQFHYMTWPDHGVPNVHDFLQFVWTVRNTKPTLPGPVLVHCSAGIGRTGTYIALDILLDEMEDTGRVDIMKVVTQMRDQRKGVVQTKEQYEMIFVGMLELAHLGNTTLSSLDFQQKYAKQKGSMSMGKKTVDQLAQEVVRLNDTPYEGDANKYKVWASGRQDMIAMSPPSRLSKNGYLLVSVPKGAEESFWRLMIDNDSDTVITLSSKTEVDLIPRPSTSKTHGKITVTALHEASVIHEITEKVLQVETKEHGEKREIQHYCVHGWTPTIDSATLISCLTTMTEKIQEQQEKVRLHPVTVVYRESEAKHAITLCITNNIMTGIKLDKEVEVFNNVRRFQSVLPKIKLTKEDFAFFCNLAFLNLEASTLYANCPSTSN